MTGEFALYPRLAVCVACGVEFMGESLHGPDDRPASYRAPGGCPACKAEGKVRSARLTYSFKIENADQLHGWSGSA